MSNRQAKFASAIVVGVLASLPFPSLFDGAARAADSCLTEPNGATPQGKHWFYRIERGSGRHCWYLRGEDELPARAAAPETTMPAKTPPSRDSELLAPSALADAHAEWPARPAVAQDAPGQRSTLPTGEVSGAAPSNNALQASSAADRSDPSRATQLLVSPPESSAAAASNQFDATAAPTSAQAAMPTNRNMGSLQKLLLVAFGALALAGLSGSAVYRLAAVRGRTGLRRDRWPPREVQQIADDGPIPPWVQPEIDSTAAPDDPGRARLEFDGADTRVERIEDFLARLTKQLEAELEAPRPERQRATN
jgi:hypothetical protein